MADTSLGRVGIRNRGRYSASATYRAGDYVYYMGSTFIALQALAAGTTPDHDGVYWNFLAEGASVEQVLQNFAPIEDGSTASSAYTAGSYILHEDVLYKTLTDIAAGDTFTVGTNIEQVTIGEEMHSLAKNFAPEEDSSTASRAYAAGDYLVYNEHLYKVTSAIAAGGTLTPGTNIQITTTAAEIITINNMRDEITYGRNAAGFHNGIYRGKDITSYLTNGSLWDRIKGTNGYALFEDLYLGDYITVGSNSYAIVDFDYYIRCGSTDITEHHLVMMPTGNMNIPSGTVLYGSSNTLSFINTANAGVTVTSQETATAFKWNATMAAPNTNSTAGGYKFSRMRQTIMKAADTIVVNAFGSSHVKPITVLYYSPSANTDSGLASGWAWFDSDTWTSDTRKSICDLLNEIQVYGQQVWGHGSAYTNVGYEVGMDKFQFAIFKLHRAFADMRANWWLRSVYSATNAADVTNYGDANYLGSSYARGVRPRFLLVG